MPHFQALSQRKGKLFSCQAKKALPMPKPAAM
jgi:hypothetical protein